MNTPTTTAMSITKPFTTTTFLPLLPSTTHHHHHRRLRLPPIRTTTNSSDSNTSSSSSSVQPPPDGVEIRFKRGSRRRRQQQDDDGGGAKKEEKKKPPKDWEAMTFNEKALELYVGEKGMLFWLNKFAYASIYIIIGAWILFRFVGPALNLYQLDTPPLSPTAILKG